MAILFYSTAISHVSNIKNVEKQTQQSTNLMSLILKFKQFFSQITLWKGIQVKFFTVNQNLGKTHKRILTKFELLYFLPFSRCYSSKLTILLLLQCYHLVSVVRGQSNMKIEHTLFLEDLLIFTANLALYFVLTTTPLQLLG